MNGALQLQHVTKQYAGFTLKDVSFTLPSGCIMGLIGENGAGKSTTMKLILGLIQKDSGSIAVFGEDHLKHNTALKEQIGVVFDECCFPENLNAKHVNTVLKGIYRQWEEDTFYRYLRRFSLPKEKTIKEYSRGMKMKLAIAAALSHKARLLLLDEATSGLDPAVREELLDVFLDFISDERNSVLLSSHIISDLEKVCDYITFLHKGKLVLTEEKDRLLEEYGVLKCSASDWNQVPREAVKGVQKNQFGVQALVLKRKVHGPFTVDPATLEDIMLFHIKEEDR